MSNETIECPDCHEVNTPATIRCARCGRSLETDDQRRIRLAKIERGRRDAERDSANFPRLSRTGPFNLARSVDAMSSQRLRRILLVIAAIGVGLVVRIIVG
ncbi:MAG TPA: hypothetical protein VIJ99_07465 [Acidimicrobiales bacterium]